MADLIERDAALAYIDCCLGNSLGGRKEFDSGLMQARKFVTIIPAVNRWIPCSERMPTMNEMRQSDCVLVCALDENWIGMAYYIGDGWAFADAQTKPRLETVEITHWMPLPELPKEDET